MSRAPQIIEGNLSLSPALPAHSLPSPWTGLAIRLPFLGPRTSPFIAHVTFTVIVFHPP